MLKGADTAPNCMAENTQPFVFRHTLAGVKVMKIDFDVAKKLFSLDENTKATFTLWLAIAIDRCEHFCNLYLSERAYKGILKLVHGDVFTLSKYPVQEPITLVSEKGEQFTDFTVLSTDTGLIKIINYTPQAVLKTSYTAGYNDTTRPADLSYAVMQYAFWLSQNSQKAGVSQVDIDGVGSYQSNLGIPPHVYQIFKAHQRVI